MRSSLLTFLFIGATIVTALSDRSPFRRVDAVFSEKSSSFALIRDRSDPNVSSSFSNYDACDEDSDDDVLKTINATQDATTNHAVNITQFEGIQPGDQSDDCDDEDSSKITNSNSSIRTTLTPPRPSQSPSSASSLDDVCDSEDSEDGVDGEDGNTFSSFSEDASIKAATLPVTSRSTYATTSATTNSQITARGTSLVSTSDISQSFSPKIASASVEATDNQCGTVSVPQSPMKYIFNLKS